MVKRQYFTKTSQMTVFQTHKCDTTQAEPNSIVGACYQYMYLCCPAEGSLLSVHVCVLHCGGLGKPVISTCMRAALRREQTPKKWLFAVCFSECVVFVLKVEDYKNL